MMPMVKLQVKPQAKRSLARAPMLGLSLVAFGLTCGLVRASAASEPFPTRGERILSPGRSAASEDSGEALVLNPANLGWLTGKEVRWTGVRCSETRRVACGHAIDLSTPVLFGFGTGFRVDYVMPPSTAGSPYNGLDYVWLTWGLGYISGSYGTPCAAWDKSESVGWY